jgi:hypothetical protein
MRDKKKHILTLMLFLFLILSTVATSRPPPYVWLENRTTCKTDDEYLFIIINTRRKAENYVVAKYFRYRYLTEEDLEEIYPVSLFFDGQVGLQRFRNKISEEGENISGWEIVAFYNYNDFMTEEPGEIIYGENVFETYVEKRKFVVKIKKEIIKYNNINNIQVILHNPKIEDKDEMYVWRGLIDIKEGKRR